MDKHIIYGILFFLVAHVLTWLQMNTQFLNEWVASHKWVMALLGFPIALLFLHGTAQIVQSYGEVWPSRIIGFSIGTLVFSVMTYAIMSEGINLKTGVCLILSVAIILIQLFWK